MSLVAQALVLVVARCARGRTWAGDAVVEQPIDPLSNVLRKDDGSGKPTIAVYVEAAEGEPDGLETQRGAQKLALKVVIYTPLQWRETAEGLVFQDEGVPLALNLIARQVDRALHFGNSTWVSIFRTLAKSVEERKVRYLLIELENGLRIPAAEVLYTVKTVAEPEFGTPLFGGWLALDTALRAGGDDAVADLFKHQIEMPDDLQPYAQFQTNANLSDAAFEASGYAPVITNDDGSVPVLTEVDASVDEVTIVPPDP